MLLLFLMTIVQPSPAAALPLVTQQNLIKNGDFEQGLAFWQQGVISPRGTDYPIMQIASEAANHYVYMDVPWPSGGYLEQGQIRIPAGAHAIFSMMVWAASAEVGVRVLVVDSSSGRTDQIDYFDPEGKIQIGGTPTHHAYNVTAYSGHVIAVRIAASGLTETGSIAMIDDVVLAASYDNFSIISLEASDRGIFSHQTGFAPLDAIVNFRGKIAPVPKDSVPVHLEFRNSKGSLKTEKTFTDNSGSYTIAVNFTVPGIWTVRSYWDGDGQHQGAISAPKEFAVAKPMEIQLLQCDIRGIPIDDTNEPAFEVKPNEKISASLTMSVGDSWVLTNVFAILLDSWEPNKWAVVSFQWGWNAEPMYYKQVYVAPDDNLRLVQRNPLTGRYETNITVHLPLTGDYYRDFRTDQSGVHGVSGDIPSFQAPAQGGTYYVGFLMSEVNNAQTILNEQKVWTQSRDYFERFISSNRSMGYIQFIRVTVVDVDSYMALGKDSIDRAKANQVEVPDAVSMYAEALSEYARGHYSLARTLAIKASELADAEKLRVLEPLEAPVKSRFSMAWWWTLFSTNVVSPTPNREFAYQYYAKLTDLVDHGDYGQARQLLDQLERLVYSDGLLYLAIAVMVWVGLGHIAGRAFEKVLGKRRNPFKLLSRLIASRLFARVKKHRTLISDVLAALLLLFLFEVIEGILESPYPPIGSLLLASCVVGGMRFEFPGWRFMELVHRPTSVEHKRGKRRPK